MSSEHYRVEKIYLETLDPVHIGTGGMRLGRVDNPIVREPGTMLPKIPGSTLNGVARAYAAIKHSKDGKPRCAGRYQCGKSDCPVCYTFGSLNGSNARAGVISIGDARIFLFPVHSMVGPVWVTSPETIGEGGLASNLIADNSSIVKGIFLGKLKTYDRINLNWLMVSKSDDTWNGSFDDLIPEIIRERVVIVDEGIFSKVVNSGLDVRTSVSIDPKTGAAESGALFTVEAIPRACILTFELVLDNFRHSASKNKPSDNPVDIVKSGLRLAEFMGVGGMSGRGFGRLRMLETAGSGTGGGTV
ncbi:MAG: type III-B CRISPR module RAMP protein Cmr4 [Candidatus Thorarchaeota archaeon]|nr:type III-B CRISPR module RAMP protein Cmr4 [Candidatus Thorarchaeota archaeon]